VGSSYVVAADDPSANDVRALLARHLTFAHEHSDPDDVHALDMSGLQVPSISFYSIRDDGRLLGIGALKELDPTHGELKSMHTALEARGRGIGRAMLEHLIAVARSRGYQRVSLETSSADAFIPARTMYASVGFEVCPPFADYWLTEASTCMTLALSGRRD
jgi:putative acetyltransferase